MNSRMKNLLTSVLAVLVLVMTAGYASCEEDIGVPCKLSTAANTAAATTSSSLINSQAMDCRSRICLSYGGSNHALCTAVCENDGDCPESTDKCKVGFTCIPGTETGSLACCKMCVCKDDTSDEGGDSTITAACKTKSNLNCPKL